MAANCEKCRQSFADQEYNDKLADLIESQHPKRECQGCSVGEGSPGPVQEKELLERLLCNPVDYDPETNTIHAAPFEKVFKNGLSVMRSIASNDDVLAILEEKLAHDTNQPIRQLHVACVVSVAAVREYLSDGEPAFGVYDQTVNRRDASLPPVPTHASILQRFPPPKTAGRKQLQKDLAAELREMFIGGRIEVQNYRAGRFQAVNTSARAGAYRQTPADT